jgi:hypothetical protein
MSDKHNITLAYTGAGGTIVHRTLCILSNLFCWAFGVVELLTKQVYMKLFVCNIVVLEPWAEMQRPSLISRFLAVNKRCARATNA